MSREDFSFSSRVDQIEIAGFRWPASGRAIGVLQISHGMGEHSLRYAGFAEFLNHAGYHVYANDHRGHGRTAKSKAELGDFGTGGWDAVVDDMATLTRLIRDREKMPVSVLGHSMGSFALQQYLLDHSALIAAAIISGSAAPDLLPSGDPSQPVDLSSFNQEFEPARTPFDWLSRDPAEVDKYVADPLCGFGVNPKSMQGMTASRKRTADPAQLRGIKADLPIYIFAGDADPVNHHLEWLTPLAARYRAAGLKNVTEKYYAAGRHEMLNETNRAEVMADTLAWLRKAH